MAGPLTKEERERLAATAERWNALGQDKVIEVFAGAVAIEVWRYEATVKDREDRIATLEAENARLGGLVTDQVVTKLPESQ